MDPKTYEPPQPPLIAQLPQMQLLPQHVITSGVEKNCIRLRGLPYEAKVEHILHFLDDFANHIIYQGVHLVYNAQVSLRVCVYDSCSARGKSSVAPEQNLVCLADYWQWFPSCFPGPV